jgi:hypothetical protein
MAFSRRLTPDAPLHGSALDAAMVGIGMVFTASHDPLANLEDTVLAASVLGADEGDLRVLSVLVTWLGVHHERLNADRLVHLVQAQDPRRVQAFWASVARWLSADRRLAKLQPWSGQRLDLLPVGTEFQIKRRGEDPLFEGGPLRVPAGTLRDREIDVLSPADLAQRHASYRQRVIMGPSYRADMWALLEAKPQLSTSELARRTYGSFATAWQVKRDFALLRPSAEAAPAKARRAS